MLRIAGVRRSGTKGLAALLLAVGITAGFGAVSLDANPRAGSKAKASATDHAQDAHGPAGELSRLRETSGPRAALAKLRALSRTDPATASSCHHHAHEIGRAALARYGFVAAIRDRNDLCVAGYMHGVLETYIGGATNLRRAMERACGGASARTRPGDECYHGVGHGLMNQTHPDRVRALGHCHSYREALARKACSDGVWMAAFSPHEMPGMEMSTATESTLDPAQTLRLCRGQALRDRESCFRQGTANVVKLRLPVAYAAGFRWCRSAGRFAGGCVAELGSQLATESGDRPAHAESVCMTAPEALVASCIEGVAVSYFSYFAADPEPGKRLCLSLRAENRPACERSTRELNAYLCPPGKTSCVPGWQSPRGQVAAICVLPQSQLRPARHAVGTKHRAHH